MHVKKLSLLVTVFTLLLGAIATETARAESTVESFNETMLLAQITPPRAPRVRGVVKSVVGTQVLVELDRAQEPFLWVGVPQAQLGSLNLM